MKTVIRAASALLYCDTGPQAGSSRADVTLTVYLTADEATAWQGAGDLTVTMPGAVPAGEPPSLAALPARLRRDPAWRAGYNRGYADRDRRDRDPGSLASPAPVLPAGGLPGRRVYDVTAGPLGPALEPGVRAERDLTRLTRAGALAPAPCCGRTVRLPAPGEQPKEPVTVSCCRCALLWQAEIIPAPDDGYGSGQPEWLALFSVTRAGITAAGHRP